MKMKTLLSYNHKHSEPCANFCFDVLYELEHPTPMFSSVLGAKRKCKNFTRLYSSNNSRRPCSSTLPPQSINRSLNLVNLIYCFHPRLSSVNTVLPPIKKHHLTATHQQIPYSKPPSQPFQHLQSWCPPLSKYYQLCQPGKQLTYTNRVTELDSEGEQTNREDHLHCSKDHLHLRQYYPAATGYPLQQDFAYCAFHLQHR